MDVSVPLWWQGQTINLDLQGSAEYGIGLEAHRDKKAKKTP
jgi:hypothetical protein